VQKLWTGIDHTISGDKVEAIEQYFVFLAANEEDIRVFGFRTALRLPGAEEAIKALASFGEDFAAFKQDAQRLGKAFSGELERVEAEGKFVEQVALVSLRLRMAQARTRERVSLAAALARTLNISSSTKSLFDESQVSLHAAIINLEKLRSLCRRASSLLRAKEESDDEVFKPSNVRSDRVVELIDVALTQIRASASLGPEEIERLEAYLSEARSEAQAEKPSWSKIVGALVIVAAVTSGLADALVQQRLFGTPLSTFWGRPFRSRCKSICRLQERSLMRNQHRRIRPNWSFDSDVNALQCASRICVYAGQLQR
jgi:hypothetical protein